MGIDVAYCNLQVMHKVKELLKNKYGILYGNVKKKTY